MTAPKVDDRARAAHDFNNCLQGLVNAVQEGDEKLSARCILDLQNMYGAVMAEAAAMVAAGGR